MIKSGLNDYLLEAIGEGTSDLHLTVGLLPMIRVDGKVRPLSDHPHLTPIATREMIYEILSNTLRQRLENDWELDFAYTLPHTARFRVNVYFQRGSLGAAFRMIPDKVKGFEELGLPKAVEGMANKPRGLILVTGPTGSGKSTTLAAMIDQINQTHQGHIMSVEDPIEFLHTHKNCIVNQREVNQDTKSFSEALRHVLRQDPDVILIGEMRDLETISMALTAAETGHLVLATLHTQDAPQTIDRVIDVFPPHQQHQVRVQLAIALEGVLSQTLVPRREGKGRVVACEVLVPTPGVRNLIREGKNHQIYSAMQTGSKFGMQTIDTALVELARRGQISSEEAHKHSSNPEELARLMGSSGSSFSSPTSDGGGRGFRAGRGGDSGGGGEAMHQSSGGKSKVAE